MLDNKHYKCISTFYAKKTAKRSKVPLINHINEGLEILGYIGATRQAKEAYCIHPLLQNDSELYAQVYSPLWIDTFDPIPLVLAMEYRAVANAYLPISYTGITDIVYTSTIPEVNYMLIADKVQNRKDFEIYHKDYHPNSDILTNYFNNWLKALEVTEDHYVYLKGILLNLY